MPTCKTYLQCVVTAASYRLLVLLQSRMLEIYVGCHRRISKAVTLLTDCGKTHFNSNPFQIQPDRLVLFNIGTEYYYRSGELFGHCFSNQFIGLLRSTQYCRLDFTFGGLKFKQLMLMVLKLETYYLYYMI